MAVRPGVVGSAVDSAAERPGEVGIVVGLVGFWLESRVTGRMVAPLEKGELDEDLGERGDRELGPSELCAPGDSGEEILPLFVSDLRDLRSRLGTVEFRDGMLGGHGGRILQLGLRVAWSLDSGCRRYCVLNLSLTIGSRTGDLSGSA